MKLIALRDCYVPAIENVVKEGDVIEVDDTAGESLVEQGWKRAPEAKKTRDGVTDGA